MCGCPPGTQLQEYTNQVLVYYPHGKTRKHLSIDKCLASEIQSLWDHGIRTTGCCCGHNEWRHLAFIGVVDDDIPHMKGLGYMVRPNPVRPGDEDSFVPKSV